MKKLIVIASIGMCLCGSADSQRVVCDGNSCRIEPAGQTAHNKPASAGKESCYTVVSPVGHSAIKPIEQVPRLKTLAGKTIAVVGHNFMARAYATAPYQASKQLRSPVLNVVSAILPHGFASRPLSFVAASLL